MSEEDDDFVALAELGAEWGIDPWEDEATTEHVRGTFAYAAKRVVVAYRHVAEAISERVRWN